MDPCMWCRKPLAEGEGLLPWRGLWLCEPCYRNHETYAVRLVAAFEQAGRLRDGPGGAPPREVR